MCSTGCCDLLLLRLLFIAVISSIIVLGQPETRHTCTPNKFVLLRNCSLISMQSKSWDMTIANRSLSVRIPYLFQSFEKEDNFSIEIVQRPSTMTPLIRFNLNLIQCSQSQTLRWTSVEASSTLRGEFLRTALVESNEMYFSLGVTYLRNLTRLDCSNKILYRTEPKELFRIDFQMESTLNDTCSETNRCYPTNVYQCQSDEQRCQCRYPLQSYLTADDHWICIEAVQRLDQCRLEHVPCLSWCQSNSSSTQCLCPSSISTKTIRHDRAFCQAHNNGICNSLLQCPEGDRCFNGICQNLHSKLLQSIASLDLVTIMIIISSLIFFALISILAISFCLLRRHRSKERSHTSINNIYRKKQTRLTDGTTAITSDYDNIIYGVFGQNLNLSSTASSSDDPINDQSPFTTSDGLMYQPKVVYLGGEQQLTAIYA